MLERRWNSSQVEKRRHEAPILDLTKIIDLRQIGMIGKVKQLDLEIEHRLLLIVGSQLV